MLRTTTILSVILTGLFLVSQPLFATSQVDELKEKINDRSDKIQELEREIAKIQKEADVVSKEKVTLQTAVSGLEISEKNISTQIKTTVVKIDKTDLTISQLSNEIEKKEQEIDIQRKALAETLRRVNEKTSRSLLESLLAYENISDWWNEVETIEQFQASVQKNMAELRGLKEEMSSRVKKEEEERYSLSSLQRELSSQHDAVAETKAAKARLLTETKSKEENYRLLIANLQKMKEQFQEELFRFESQLQIAIDPSKLPSVGKGVLQWPLDNIFITQNFGKTSASGRLYSSGTHNGVDFRAAQGTSVKSAADGVVQATGNTDEQKTCYSYGRWILIKHNNGLSTLYAHLSGSAVSAGQVVQRGQVIGSSGGTPGTFGSGYSTGPHLHFTVYASEGVRIQQYVSSINCKNTTIPLADQKAYLDPLLYL